MVSQRDDKDIHGFLSRWSQRKRAAEESVDRAEMSPDVAEQRSPESAGGSAEPTVGGNEESGAQAKVPVDPAELPDIDSLDASSDFSVFMKDGVPPALRRRALRKLWHSDPVFNRICELDDYNLDYTDAAMVVPNLKTLYQVGKGMVLPDAPAEAEVEKAGGGDGRSDGPPQVTAETPAAASDAPVEKEAAAEPSAEQAGAAAGESVASHEPDPQPESVAATPQAAAVLPERRSARQRRWGGSES